MSTVYEIQHPFINFDKFKDEKKTNHILKDLSLNWFENEQKYRLRFINENDELSYLWFNTNKNNICSFTKYGCCDVSEMILKLEWVFGVKFWDEHTIQKYSFPTH